MASEDQPIVVVSDDEAARVQELGRAFRTQLYAWMGGVTKGCRYTPGVARELARSLIDIAILSMALSKDQIDSFDEERCNKITNEIIETLEREVAS